MMLGRVGRFIVTGGRTVWNAMLATRLGQTLAARNGACLIWR